MHTLHSTIKKSGGRLTKTKQALLEVLASQHCLLSKATIIKQLQRKHVTPNRSTLYRELVFLVKHHIINQSTINGTDYFELAHQHHHHLVCLGCNNIERVDMDNHLTKQEQYITKQHQFNIINHLLEFYGYCQKCQN
ncbi:MAG: transcriptional repressor [Patescibacteria group bacterium]|jgi:Fur family ferric uptake transcriptional regulator